MMIKTRQVVNRRKYRRRQEYRGGRRVRRWIIVGGLVLSGLVIMGLLAAFGAVVSAYAYYAEQLPQPGEIKLARDFETTKLYDRTGNHIIYEVVDPLGGDRTWVSLSDVPLDLQRATIALEDRSFYENPGYDSQGILRALWNNLWGGQIQGGSSITQQLVKNMLIDPSERTRLSFDRKLKELILASRINSQYSKDQILEWYLNTNFYGNLAYGIEAASQVYFGKSVRELTLAESAMLAAIPQSPALNPIDNYEFARERQRLVLDQMVGQGYITQEQADLAYQTPLELKAPEQRFNLLAPHFAIAARKQVEQLLGPDQVYRGGLVVYTTLDYDLFLQAECAARTHVARLSGQAPSFVVPASNGSECVAAQYLSQIPIEDQSIDHHVSNSSVVIIDPATAEVLAIVGSLDYYNQDIAGNYNVALALRQPGSAIKPFTYLTAFEQGYTPATMTLDVRTAFQSGSNLPYSPENADRRYHGPQSIRDALANSYNVPAVQVLSWVGIENVLRTAHAMGITSLDRGADQYGLSLTLGGGEVSLYDMTYAYSVLANLGEMRGRPTPQDQKRPGFRMLDPTLILRVEDSDGHILWEYGKSNTFSSSSIVEPGLAYLVTDILSDDNARQPSVGPNSALSLADRPAAVKTGTTNDFRDNWTIGYTPQMVTGVWVGNADNSAMINTSAILGAAPIWKAVMLYAHKALPVQNWARPDSLTELTVCQKSGLLPTPYCPTHQELFLEGTEPKTQDTMFQPFAVNKDTGLLATVYTPPDLVEQRIFEILPPEAMDWAREAGIPQPPTAYDTVNSPETTGAVVITDPKPFAYIKGLISLQGNAQDPGFQFYRLDYGQGLNPQLWFQIGEDQRTPVAQGVLGSWDASGLDGLYSLRLTVVRGDSTLQQFIIQVTVDNVPPSLQLIHPTDNQIFSQSDEFIEIQPVVADNVSMDRVEFYVDDKLIATSTVAPFNQRWFIDKPGTHVIQVRAYDAAGNTVASQRVAVQVLP